MSYAPPEPAPTRPRDAGSPTAGPTPVAAAPAAAKVVPKVTRAQLREALAIFAFVRPYRWSLIIGMVLLAVGSLVFMAFPYLIGEMVDTANGAGELGLTIPQLGLVLLTILVVQAVVSYFRVLLFARVSELGIADVRKAVFARLITLPIYFFERNRSGELISRLTADVEKLYSAFSITIAEFLRQVLILLFGITFIVARTPKLSLIMLLTFPVVVLGAIAFGRYVRRLSKQRQEALATTNNILGESIQSIQAVKAYVNEGLEVMRYGRAQDATVRVSLRYARVRAAFSVFIITFLFGALFFIIYQGARFVERGDMASGDLLEFALYTAILGGAIAGLGNFYTELVGAVGATERIREMLREPTEPLPVRTSPPSGATTSGATASAKTDHDRTPATGSPNGKTDRLPAVHGAGASAPTARHLSRQDGARARPHPLSAQGEIRFTDVRFRYPSRPDVPVLQGLDLAVHAGQRVALVGPSGAGKSTVLQLLLRFYEGYEGQITLDGTEIRELDLGSYRSTLGIVPQEVLLFAGSIADNIGYGRPDASRAEVEDAARQANALEFIQRFPEGFDTLVGERGVKLSGGQRQRIAIARALLKDPAVLLLDEATSSLDAEGERVVQEALDRLMVGRTSFVVAHRLATIREVDRIFVIDGGQVVESGTHETLNADLSSLYASLAKLQFEQA